MFVKFKKFHPRGKNLGVPSITGKIKYSQEVM